MKNQLQTILLILFTLFAGPLTAQEDKGKIIIEITKDINGEKKTFRGEYNSIEEMEADPNYQEYAGSNNQFNFWFGDDDPNQFFQLDQMKDLDQHLFKFFGEDDRNNSFFFFDMDSVSRSFDFDFESFDEESFSRVLKERMKNLGIEIEALADKFGDEDHRMKIITMKRIGISDVTDEFGKKGRVAKNDRLNLNDLSFYPNPSKNGRIKIKFTAPEEGDLEIKISKLEGKEVFVRFFESFSGYYSESIDLSGQKEGIYLLEISQGKKRLTKKIVVEN